MKILITGAFGNIGKAVIEEACKRQHEIVVFEVSNKKTRKTAIKYRSKAQVIFGDIRQLDTLQAAVEQADAVIHLAAIIPPASKKNRITTLDINYNGTQNLVNVIKTTRPGIPFVFTSSASVMGPTQHQNPPVNRNDSLVGTGNYEESKIKCETYLRENADNYLIFRLAGVLPTFSTSTLMDSFSLLEELFDMHPDMRLEMVTAQDIAVALIVGAEKLKTNTTPKNQAYILGGGQENGWQLRGDKFLARLFSALSLPVPDRKYFTPNINTYHLDWYDTNEAQQEFHYQNHTFNDYLKQVKKTFRFYRLPIKLLRRYLLTRLVKMSPYQP